MLEVPWLQPQHHRRAQGAAQQNRQCCHSELQFFKMGIAMCFIEMRGSTIREAKSRSFELITPSKTFRYPGIQGGEQGGAARSGAWVLVAAAP